MEGVYAVAAATHPRSLQGESACGIRWKEGGGGSLFFMIGSAGLCGGLMLPSMLSAPQTLFCSTCMHKLSSAMSLLVNSLKLQADVQV